MASDRHLKELYRISRIEGNFVCADCSVPSKLIDECLPLDPKWASSSLGIFICIRCAGVHRSLGTHITKVKSLSLDKWDDMSIQVRGRDSGLIDRICDPLGTKGRMRYFCLNVLRIMRLQSFPLKSECFVDWLMRTVKERYSLHRNMHNEDFVGICEVLRKEQL